MNKNISSKEISFSKVIPWSFVQVNFIADWSVNLLFPETDQIESALHNVESIDNLAIAYEPIWAIGTGIVPEASEVEETLGVTIRNQIRSLYGTPASNETPLLYGGSVNPGNAYDFGQAQNIDGVLVGGASLNAAQFVEICRQFTLEP